MIPELVLDRKVALVTGASRSIGRATACLLAEAGADVALAARGSEALEATAREVEARGRRALPVTCDVSRPDEVRELVARCVAELGVPAIAVANAGVFQQWGPTTELSDEDWSRIVEIDLTGVFTTCREAGRAMAAAGGGSIVTISSVAGLVALAGAAAYSAAKAGVIGLTRALAAEWAPLGVRVNCVVPGFVVRDGDPHAGNPELLARIAADTPLGGRGEPRDVALAALYLGSPAAAFVTGAVLCVDGGWTAV